MPKPEIFGAEQKVERIQETPEHGLSLATHEESLFIQPNDYWTIRYQGHVGLIKSTRGLHYLAILLRDPGREFHVRELLAHPLDASAPSAGVAVPEQVTGGLFYGFPVLDAQAKAEYKRRINELRDELEEAEQVNYAHRKTEIQNELQAICHHLAYAVGLRGKDRKTCSDTERARSAITKCIKKAIRKIGEAIPSLGYHLADSTKTGYFCSYNPHPDRAVAWKFYLSFLISIALPEASLPLCEV